MSRPNAQIAAIALHVLVPLMFAAIFFLLLSWKAGQQVHPSWMLEYPRIFASIGLAMLPLPREIHPWMSVLGVYLLGLLLGLNGWRRRSNAVVFDMFVYLGMLGVGLFVYYAGRSHILNLINVCWPAVLIIGIALDRSLAEVRTGQLPRSHVCLLVAGIAFLVLASGSFLIRAPLLAKQVVRQFETRGIADQPFVASELRLIRRHAGELPSCLLLSRRQGIYLAEAGGASALQGLGLVETVLKSDQDALIADVLSGRFACIFLGVGADSDPGLGLALNRILAHYTIADQNSEGTVFFLMRR